MLQLQRLRVQAAICDVRKKLSEKQISDVILKGKSSKIKGFTNHPDHLTEGIIRISDQGEAELAAE